MRTSPLMHLIPAILLGVLVSAAIPAVRSLYTRGATGARAKGATNSTRLQRDWREDHSTLQGEAITEVDIIRYFHRTRKWANGDLGTLIDDINANGLKGVFSSEVLRSSIKEAALADPRGTLETILTKLAPENGRDAALRTAFDAIAASTPEEAIAFLPRIPDYLRDHIENSISDQLANQKGVQALIGNPSGLPQREWAGLLENAAEGWAQKDPVGATRAMLALAGPGASDASNVVEQIVRDMSAKDFALASQALPQLARYAEENKTAHAGDAMDKLMSDLYKGRSKDARIAALKSTMEKVQDLPDGPQRIDAIRTLAAEAGMFDRNQVTTFAQMLPSCSARKQAYEQALDQSRVYAMNPDGSTDLLKTGNSAANADWAQTIPDPLSKYAVEKEVVDDWVNADPAAFAKYALSSDQGSDWANILVQKFPALAGGAATTGTMPAWVNTLPAGELQALQALAEKQAAPPAQ